MCNMASSTVLLVSAIFALKALSPCAPAQVITVSSSSPQNESLAHYLCHEGHLLEHGTTIALLAEGEGEGEGFSLESGTCVLRGLREFSLVGVGERPAVIRCGGVGGGLAFLNSSRLSFANVTFEGCGAAIPEQVSSLMSGGEQLVYVAAGQKAALSMVQVEGGVDLEGVAFTGSRGFSVLGLDVLGRSRLRGLNVSHTSHDSCSTTGYECLGSGVVFVYRDSPFTSASGSTYLSIDSSSFSENTERYFDGTKLSIFHGFDFTGKSFSYPLTGGPALAVHSSQQDYSVAVNVTDSVFVGNSGPHTGSVLLVLYNSIHSTSVHFTNCSLDHNRCNAPVDDVTREGDGSGGMLVLMRMRESGQDHGSGLLPSYDVFTMQHSVFSNNECYYSGGIHFRISQLIFSMINIQLEDVQFLRNQGQVGSALYCHSTRSYFSGVQVHFLLKDITAAHNVGDKELSTPVYSSGAFSFININSVSVVGSELGTGSVFSSSYPGALFVTGGDLFLSGKVVFRDNRGLQGGAVSLYDHSILFIKQGSTVLFQNNSADYYGGAIFITSAVNGLTDTCSIQFIGDQNFESIQILEETSNFDFNITFVNNTAVRIGKSIYGDLLYNCFAIPGSVVMGIDHSELPAVYRQFFSFPESDIFSNNEIFSVASHVCICNGTEFIGDEYHCIKHTARVDTFPGKKFTLNLISVDANYVPVTSLLFSVLEPEVATINQAVHLTDFSCTEREFIIYGHENISLDLVLSTRLGIVAESTKVAVEVGHCPHGFELVQDEDTGPGCSCNTFLLEKVKTTCNSQNFTVLRPGSAWIGFSKDSDGTEVISYASSCPIGYCKLKHPEVDLSRPNSICANNRAGVLCGSCIEGYSVVLGSAECLVCTNYFIFTVLLYAVLGLVFVVVMFLLDLTVHSGTVNGLIFYASLVSVNANILFPQRKSFLFVFIESINLQMGFPLCFYDGMTDEAKIGLSFIFPFFISLLSIGIVLLSRYTMIVHNSPVAIHVLDTLVYMMSIKLLRVAVDTLSFGTLITSSGHHITIWSYDGDLEYISSTSHGILFACALLVLLVFIPYTLYLTVLPDVILRYNICKSNKVHAFLKLHKLKPLIDVYYAPFKDHARVWLGLRLILLFVLCVAFAIVGTDWPGLVLTLQVITLLPFCIAQAHLRPFRKWSVEILDMFFNANFLLLALSASLDVENHDRVDTITTVMVTLAFVAFCGIIGFHVCARLGRVPCFQDKARKLKSIIKNKWKHLKTNQTAGGDSPDTGDGVAMKRRKRSLPSHLEQINPMESAPCKVTERSGVTMTVMEMEENNLPSLLSFSKYLREPVMDYDY